MIAAALAGLVLAATPERILTNTETITSVAVSPGAVWVGTTGGVERYDARTLRRTGHFTTADGLASNDIVEVKLGRELTVRSRARVCRPTAPGRFACEAEAPKDAPIRAGDQLSGARVRARAALWRRTLLGTSDGLWIEGAGAPRRLTPAGQPCTNFAMALEVHEERLYMGAFDGGLCVSADGERFEPIEGAPRMVNDLASTNDGLYVAANEGLYRIDADGAARAVPGISRRGVNAVAWDGARLLATTPGAVWSVDAGQDRARAHLWMPGGSRSLQDVAVGRNGTVWLASEDRGAIRLRGKRARVFDKLAGLPTSWGIRIAVDDRGTAHMATLRHGLVSVSWRGRQESSAEADPTWLLAVRAEGRELLVGGQGGAFVRGPGGRRTDLEGLPHPNVHAFARFGDELYVGTEGGTAVYRLE